MFLFAIYRNNIVYSSSNFAFVLTRLEAVPTEHNTDEEYFWNRLQQLSADAWHDDPVYKPFYHPTGFVYAACSSKVYEEQVVPYIKSLESGSFKLLETPADFQATMLEGVFTGDFPQWRGVWRRTGAGWVFAKGALAAAYQEAARLGVRFVTGSPQGEVTSLLFNASHTDVLGALTADGIRHTASHTILAAGASSDLLLDFRKQLRPTAWTLAHIRLTAEEAARYANMPVPYNSERGFLIEPDARSHELKLCDEHPGYLNLVPDPATGAPRSVPFARRQIPLEAARRVRRLLRETAPALARRPFSFARICWDADTPDRVFLIDRHPELPALVVAVGGSGNGFMNMPAVGRVVADVLEGAGETRLRRMMRWRPEMAAGRDWWDTQGRFGAEGKVMDLKDVEGWTVSGEEEVVVDAKL